MNKKYIQLLFCALFFLTGEYTFAQSSNVVTVNPVTGTAIVNIPLYAITNGGASLPMTLSYNASGVRPTDAESSAGMGWNLNAGGAITREVHGLPDDVVQDMLGNEIFGWMYNANASLIGPHVFINDNNTATYTDVATDMAFINSNFGDYSDTEPDVFHIEAPGLSCNLIYDRAISSFRTIPYSDLKISFTVNLASGPTRSAITSFKIVNDDGVTYVFSAPQTAMQKAKSLSAANYFQTTYHQYLNGITYYSAWDLTSITDAYGNSIVLTYVNGTKKGFTINKSVILATPSNPATNTPQYVLFGNNTPNLLNNVSYVDSGGSSVVFNFSWITDNGTYKDVISTIIGLDRLFQFNYDDGATTVSSLNRKFLSSVADQDCSSPFKYSFSYVGGLPDSTHTGNSVDLWGYSNSDNLISNSTPYPSILINPSTPAYDRYRNHGTETIPAAYSYTMPGANMSANGSSQLGSLTEIDYANGGSTTLAYEPNDYYDNVISANINAAGIRILSITDYDGINTANNIVRSYSYKDASGHSYGKPISLPVYAFTRPYTGTGTTQDLWNYSTVRSAGDLSGEDHSILYTTVKERQTNKGSTEFYYSNPAMANDGTITTPLAWSSTVTNVGATTTAATGFFSNDKNTYPFAPNPNFDFERGLPLKMVNYNEAGNEVSETNYLYNTPQTPIVIAALKYDVNSFGVAYAKYNIYTTTAPLVTQITTKTFDVGSTTLAHTTTATNTYNAQNKLKQVSTVNSDLSTYVNNVLYAKDYNTTTKTDSYTQAIYNLQQLNMNIPIETYFQVKPAGGSQYLTTKADVMKFGSSWPAYTTFTLPAQKLTINAPNGINGFVASSTATGNFVFDPNYVIAENDIAYDFSGNLITKADNYKNIQTTITDHNSLQPVAVFSNANWNEVAYTDFDSRGNFNSFTGSGTTRSIPARSGYYGASLVASNTQSVTLTRNLSAKNYIFSIWLQSSATGVITVTASGTGGTNTTTINFDNITANLGLYPIGWQYYEVKLPLTSITSATFTINFSSNKNIMIDDVLAYPDVSEVSTIGYDAVNFIKSSETNTNGKSTYYSFDQFGRIRYVYDQDKNIIQRNMYVNGTNAANFTNPSFSAPAGGYAAVPITFTNISGYNGCVSDATTFKWVFGDGTPEQINSGVHTSLSHTYASTGTFTTTLTAISSLYGSKTFSQSISISPLTTVYITYTNPTTGTPHTGIATLTFSQGGVTKYNFTETQLISGVSVAPGTYTIKIHPTGTNYSSVNYTGATSQCFAKTGSDIVFTDNLTAVSTVNFNISSFVCSF
jgi:hypothetical protein